MSLIEGVSFGIDTVNQFEWKDLTIQRPWAKLANDNKNVSQFGYYHLEDWNENTAKFDFTVTFGSEVDKLETLDANLRERILMYCIVYNSGGVCFASGSTVLPDDEEKALRFISSISQSPKKTFTTITSNLDKTKALAVIGEERDPQIKQCIHELLATGSSEIEYSVTTAFPDYSWLHFIDLSQYYVEDKDD